MEASNNENTPVRVFIAVDIDAGSRQRISEAVDSMSIGLAEARWVRPENFHITLKFLGDIEPAMVEKLCAILDRVVRGLPCFDAGLKGVGAFSSPAKARVVWVGVDPGANKFRVLHRNIDTVLQELGFAGDDRSFHPHVTIARLKQSMDVRETIEKHEAADFGESHVGQVVLYSSRLLPQGPEYKAIGRFDLSLS